MIPMHATATANPQQLCWVVPPDRLPPRGAVRQAPGRLGGLLEGGVIEDLTVRPAGIVITLAGAHSWRERGDGVRTALGEALADPAGWRVERSSDSTAELAGLVRELLAGPIGALARSHGGTIELVSVNGLDVTVRMSGACGGCAGAGVTLHDKLEAELRRRVDARVTVSGHKQPAPSTLGKKLLALWVR